MPRPLKKITLINSGTVFVATLVIIPTLVLIVFFTGLKEHRSLYLNSLISTSILSFALLAFLTIGLYNGWKLKDTLGKFKLRLRPSSNSEIPSLESGSIDFPDADGEGGIVGILVAVVLWIVVALLGSVILYYLSGLIWLTLVAIAAILYWIIFRAYRLIFKNSARCKGKLARSLGIAIAYTLLYNCWIYGIIWGVHFLRT